MKHIRVIDKEKYFVTSSVLDEEAVYWKGRINKLKDGLNVKIVNQPAQISKITTELIKCYDVIMVDPKFNPNDLSIIHLSTFVLCVLGENEINVVEYLTLLSYIVTYKWANNMGLLDLLYFAITLDNCMELSNLVFAWKIRDNLYRLQNTIKKEKEGVLF